MTDFIILGDAFWFAAGFAACYFAGRIKAWLSRQETGAATAAKAAVDQAASDIKAKL